MNKLFKIITSILVAIMLIIILKPYVDDYNEQKQYDFTVNTLNGNIKKDDFKGKSLALYFGYTYCPDVCPTSLSALAQALNNLPQNDADKITGLFISVDPDRDTLENLEKYAKYFHPSFQGATSTKENIDDITARYKAHYQRVELENSAMGYSVAHTSIIYLFDKNGKFKEAINHFSNPIKIKESLEKVIAD